jgi:hypothetical protein
MGGLSKNSSVVILNLFQGLPELASGLKKVEHDMLHCYIKFVKSPLIPLFQRGRFPLYSPLWQKGVRGDLSNIN